MPAAKKPTPVTGQARRFEFLDEKSSKFWEIRITAEGVEVRYGRLGAGGQTQLKAFDDAATALKAAEKLVAEKLKGGYVEQGAAASAPPPAPAPVEKPAAVKAAPPSVTAAKVAKPVTAAAAGPTADKSLCISGKLPSGRKKADYEAPLLAVGITLVDEVVKGLTYLVVADLASTSAKAEKAQKLGVVVISEEALMALVATAE